MQIEQKAEKIIEIRIEEYHQELESVLNGGDISKYNYCPSDDKDDMNFENRLRLALAILFASEGMDVEMLTVALMNEEIKLLENALYGGTTETILLLSIKMLEYKKSSYKQLFRRFKNANFDCWFECDIKWIKKRSAYYCDLHNYDRWYYLFCLLGDEESSKIMAEIVLADRNKEVKVK